MEVKRVRSELTVGLETKDDALGLYAVMSGNPNMVPPHVFQKGQEIYKYMFLSIEALAMNYEAETYMPLTLNPKR